MKKLLLEIAAIQTLGATGENLKNLVQEAARTGPDLILLPENAVDHPLIDGQKFDEFGHLDVPVVFGAPRKVTEPDLAYRTSMFLLKDGKLEALYDKRYLVPFYETWPIASVFGTATSVARGDRIEVHEIVPGLKIYPMLCFEVLLPVWERQEANLIVLLSSDRLFRAGVGQHLLNKFARLRSVETGVPVARVNDFGEFAILFPR